MSQLKTVAEFFLGKVEEEDNEKYLIDFFPFFADTFSNLLITP